MSTAEYSQTLPALLDGEWPDATGYQRPAGLVPFRYSEYPAAHVRVILRYPPAGEAVLYDACYVIACTVQSCGAGRGPGRPQLRRAPSPAAASTPTAHSCKSTPRCAVLQHVVLCCNVVGCVATWCTALQHGVLCCNVLCCVARHCAVLQRVARPMLRFCRSWLQADPAMGATGLAIKAAGCYLYKAPAAGRE